MANLWGVSIFIVNPNGLNVKSTKGDKSINLEIPKYNSKEALVEAFAEHIYEHGYVWETFKFLDEGGRNSGKSTACSRARYMLQFTNQNAVVTLGIPQDACWCIGGNASFGYA